MFDDCSVTDLYPYWNPEKEIVIGFVRTLSFVCLFLFNFETVQDESNIDFKDEA
jgi:hypothetical protein